ncbi:MAG: glycoside hydrolase family 3 C-terminal domain-containing protein [Clostridiales bacterium]|nr:glycoside hydrolase family 3 C-terminal domain-containing protein [Clostridiales bacterium]
MSAVLLVFVLAAQPVVNSFRTDIDKFLGTVSVKRVSGSEGDSSVLYTYSSDYESTTELVKALEDLGERMSEEGSVLLKNNGALPLSGDEIKKVSLLGYSSYYPVMGGDMGSVLTENTGTDADTVDFVEALEARGFEINRSLQELYTTEALYADYPDENNQIGNIKAPTVTGTFSSKEPSQEKLDETDSAWKDSMEDYNVMIVMLSRSGGENRNYFPGEEGVNAEQDLNQADPLGLSDDERELIAAAVKAKEANNGKVIVLLNNANPMEVEEIEENSGVDAILQIGFPGGYGFYGVADLLSGEANPSGHLTDTYAVDNSDAPSAVNYGNYEFTNTDANNCVNSAIVEAEQIYIGYKYYETRYMDTRLSQGNADAAVGSVDGESWDYDNEVTYPFGYGLSYTTFEKSLDDLEVDLENQKVTATVTVTNTGDVAGKEAVQLYVSLPYTEYDKQNKIEKAGMQLLDYEKTGELMPGESQTIEITADMDYMTSWDSGAENAAGTSGCYILDEGDYYFVVGENAHDAAEKVLEKMEDPTAENLTAVWSLAERDGTTFAYTKNGTAVENQLEDMDLNYWMPDTVTYLSRSDWEGTWPVTYKDLTATDEMLEMLDNDIYEITENGDPSGVVFGADNDLSLADLRGNDNIDDEEWDDLMDQLTLEEAMLRIAFGGVSTKAMESINSPEAIQNDAPNGIQSYPLGQYANYDQESGDPCAVSEDDKNLEYKAGVMANETVIAQTFSKEMDREYGEAMGNYSLWSNLTILWGCGSNIHRSVYNARNFEYYSEDCVLSAYQGAAFIEGGLAYGCLIAPKHLAFNDTEINRIGISTFMTEQQARENELRCFQSPFEDAKALAAMSSFNRVGIMPCNSHTGLLINILRNEWGFEGLISEDCIPQANYCVLKEAAINGLSMTCKTGEESLDAVAEKWDYWTVENVSQDETLLKALKQDMKWMAYALANSNALDGVESDSYMVNVRCWYDNLLTFLQAAFAVGTILCVYGYLRAGKKAVEVTENEK